MTTQHDSADIARTPLVHRLVLAAKGALIGTADIVPGVSGGTMALVLGIYTKLVDAIRSLHLRWLVPLLMWAASGFRSTERREQFVAQWRSMQVGFLINLGVGLACAVAVAGFVLPKLLEDHPEPMRGLFFGLVLASIAVPLKMVQHRDALRVILFVIVAVATFFLLTASYQPGSTPFDVTAPAPRSADKPVTLENIARLGPSMKTPEDLFWTLDAASRARLQAANPEAAIPDELGVATHVGHTHASVYSALVVPEGMVIRVPRPAVWFAFVCGVIAICAMILPGISGSFILLMLGMYYFMASALKGFLQSLLAILLGAAIGIVTFSRVLSWLLHHHRSSTMAVLAGIMLGSLGVIWPYKLPSSDGRLVNTLPTSVATAWLPVVMMIAGVVLVLGLAWLSHKLTPPEEEDAALAHDDNAELTPAATA